MQKDYQNKQMTGETTKNKKQSPATQEEYFFPGEGEYQPVTVVANSKEEALEKYDEIKTLNNK